MKYLVIGGACPLGLKIVNKLLGSEHDVIVWDDFSTGEKKYMNHKARYYLIDTEDKKIERRADYAYDGIFCLSHFEKIIKNSNIMMPLNIYGKLFLQNDCEKFVE